MSARLRCKKCGAFHWLNWSQQRSQFGRTITKFRWSKEQAKESLPLCRRYENVLGKGEQHDPLT